MLKFTSSSARIINTRRCVNECIDVALGVDHQPADLLIYNSSLGHDFNDILTESKQLYPDADVVVASCCGIVGREGVSETMNDMGLMAVSGKDYALAYENNFFGHNAYEKCLLMAKALKQDQDNINMIYFIGSGIDTNNTFVIAAFEEVFGTEVTIFGATSSDNMQGIVSYQAINNEVFENGAFAIGFSDNTLNVHTQATHGFLADGDPLVVTKATDHIIHEFNNKPAWSEYLKRLNLSPEATCGDTIPIGALGEELDEEKAIEYGNKHILRVVTKHVGDDMYYSNSIEEGTKLWITVRDEKLIFDEMTRMTRSLVEKIGDEEVVAVFHADCLARGRFLFQRVFKEELVAEMQFPFYVDGQCPPWLGMYGFGEFARLSGENTYHNYTTSLYVVTRKNTK
jgi:hypothetical protein